MKVSVRAHRAAPAVREVSESASSKVGLWISDGNVAVPSGYRRLSEAPEVQACVSLVANLIGSMTIQLMTNSKDGDVRVRDELSRFVDITPCPAMVTRQRWMSWIVSTMMQDRYGSAFVMPETRNGSLVSLTPMPGARAVCPNDDMDWHVEWKGLRIERSDVIPFISGADVRHPWRGVGLQAALSDLTESLANGNELKNTLVNPTYRPPIIVSFATDSDLSNEEKRENLRRQYLTDQTRGKPWIIPGGLMKIDTLKPMSLNDLCIKDTMELDKKAVASITGVPAFILGVGSYNRDEYNGFIDTKIMPRAAGIAQALTAGLLTSSQRFWRFSPRRLYNYGLKELSEIYQNLYVRGLADGNEVRDAVGMDPKKGLDQLVILENYIPAGMIGDQKKLNPKEEKSDA